MKRVLLAAALAFLATAANAKGAAVGGMLGSIRAADTPPQSESVPEQTKPTAPVAAIVVVHCGRIAALAVTDATGEPHPVDVAELGDIAVKKILAQIPNQLVATIQCEDNQRSTTL